MDRRNRSRMRVAVAAVILGASTAVFGSGSSYGAPVATQSRSSVESIDAQNPLKYWEDRLASHSASFGGWAFDGTSGIVVFEKGVDPTLEADAIAALPLVPARPLSVRVAAVRRSFAELMARRDDLARRLPTLLSAGIFGVGLNVSENSVVVLAADAVKAAGALGVSPGDGLEIRQEEQPTTTAGRYADGAPWNGGDYITNSNTGSACTIGFGVHGGSYSNKFISTAGHCQPGTWMNGSQVVGTTSGGVIVGPVLDSQIIPTNSSCIVWRGASTTDSNLQRWLLTGFLNNASSGNVYLEGSVGLELYGPVTANNLTVTVTTPAYGTYTFQQGIAIHVSNSLGDSGGPVVMDSGFGPLAIGSQISHTSTTTYAQNIGAYLYSYGVQLNVTSNPSYCNNA